MKVPQLSPAMRVFFAVPAIVILLGIWLTGWGTAHWILYIPVVAFSFAAISGICPGIIISNWLFKAKQTP